MYKYQDSLPKFPVPPLEQTLKDYIDAVKVCHNSSYSLDNFTEVLMIDELDFLLYLAKSSWTYMYCSIIL